MLQIPSVFERISSYGEHPDIYIRLTDVMPILEQMEVFTKDDFRALMQRHSDQMVLLKEACRDAPFLCNI